MGKQHTQDLIRSTYNHKPRLELKAHHREFTTRTELKSLTQRIKCVEAESRCLSMLRECLYCSMRQGVPFIAPRQLGAVERQFGRQFLPSVEWCTGQFGVRSLSFSSEAGHWIFGSDGTLDIVRCARDSPVRPFDRWLSHVSPGDRAGDRWSRRFHLFPRATSSSPKTWARALVTNRTVRCTTGQSGDF